MEGDNKTELMIYTSYFGQLKNLPDNIIPISICRKAPTWYTGIQYKKLAPKYDFYMKWKEDHDNEHYIKCFNKQVLSKLEATEVVIDFSILSCYFNMGKSDICLICYEKPGEFCHRHLVAEWLRSNGFRCEEWMCGGEK